MDICSASISINHILSGTSQPCSSTPTTRVCGSELLAKVPGAKRAALLGTRSRTFPTLLIYRLACSSEPERSAVSSGLQQKWRQRGEAEVGREISQKLAGLLGLILGEAFVSRNNLCSRSRQPRCCTGYH